MKILFCNGFYQSEQYLLKPASYKTRGVGFFHCITSLLRNLAEAGHDVMYAGYILGGKERPSDGGVVEVFEGVKYINAPEGIFRLVETNAEVDAIVTTEAWDDWFLPFHKSKRVAYVHNVAYAGNYKQRIESSLLDTIIATSDWHKDRLSENHSPIANKIQVVGHGIDRLLYNIPCERSSLDLIFMSAPHKGLKEITNIWGKLSSIVPDIRLKVSCSNALYGLPEYDGFVEQREKLFSLPRVVDLGVLPHHQIIQEIRSSYIHLYPSMIPDTFGLGVMEALAAGTPSVVYSVGGNVSKLLHDTKGGFLAVPNNTDDFVGKVMDILKDPAVWSSLSIGGQSILASEIYNWKYIAQKWVGILGG